LTGHITGTESERFNNRDLDAIEIEFVAHNEKSND
jgi:hypothetical protein